MTSDAEHPFICVWALCVSSWEKYLFKSFAHFLIGLLFSLVWSHVSSLYILEIKPLSKVSLANIFSHMVSSLFIFLMFSLTIQKLFLKKDFIYLFLERGREEERERGRATSMCACLSCVSHWGPRLQSRYVPWLGIEPATLCFSCQHSIHRATPARVIYLFWEREEGREKERERNTMCKRYIDWLPLAHPQLGTWPATQVCALTGNQTGDLLVCSIMLSALSHTT